MDTAALKIFQSWYSSIKCGEVTELLCDESAVQELERQCDANNALKIFSRLSSKIYELKTKPLDAVFPRASPLHLINISNLFSSLYVKRYTSGGNDESFLISLLHVIEYFLKEGYYDSSLKFKRRIEEVGYGTSIRNEKQRTLIFNNLYLIFWNHSINLFNKSVDLELVLKLRIAAIDLLAHCNPSKLPAVSERIVVTSRHYVATKKEVSFDALSKMCSDVLEIATPMVLSFLKSSGESGSQENSVEFTDRLFISVKSYSEIVIEIMRVHNISSRGKEGLELCTKYCKICLGSENLERRFSGFLDILCDIFSRMASTPAGHLIQRKDFHSIYQKLCEIQSLSDGPAEVNSEHCGIKFRSLSFLKASECVCRAIVDLWEVNVTDDLLCLCAGDENSMLLLLELGGMLSLVSDPSYSLKFMAFSLKVIIYMLANASADSGLGEYDHKVMKAKVILNCLVGVEEKVQSYQPSHMRAAINVIIKVFTAAIQLFFNKKLLVICEEFLIIHHKLISKWVQFNEFSALKDNKWWSIKLLCICRQEQKKFRPALAALALAVESRITEKYSSVFNEWAKVKINAQLSDRTDELKLSTVYHILKENMRDQSWPFSSEEIIELLKFELNAYASREACPPNAIQDVCQTILELSGDAILKAEAQLHLIELSCTNGSSDIISGETVVESGDGSVKPYGLKDPLKVSLNSCQKLADDFQKEIRNASVEDDVPAMLSVLGQVYYWMYLCKSCCIRKKAGKEISGDGGIPLKVPRKVDVNGEEEQLDDDASSCDILPPQLRLKSSKQKQLLNATLNIALAIWELADEKGLKNSHHEKFNVSVTLKCIETSAHIYELYDDLWHSIKAWCLLCKYADIFMKDEAYLLGMSNLMRKGAVLLSNSCLLRVDKIAAKLTDESPLFLTYSLGKCWQYFYKCEFSVGLPILGKVLKNCSPAMGIWHTVLSAQAKYLLALYCVHSPVDFTTSEISKDPVSKGCTRFDFAISALGTLVRCIGGWKNSGSLSLYTFAQALLLDIALWIGESYLDLYIPREAYTYLKQQFLVSQKLLLPNRTVQYLSALAFVDLMCCNETDCVVKLVGMESIMDLDIGKHKDEKVGDIKNLIEWLIQGESVAKKRNPDSFKIFIFPEDENEAAAGVSGKKEVRLYSPKRPGSNYKFIQLKKCVDKCLCEWCVDSGFQKAFSGLRVVKVCMANKGQVEGLSPASEIFENSSSILRGICRRFKMMVTRMSTFYLSQILCTSEVDMTIDEDFVDSDLFAIEKGKLLAFYVRCVLNIADFYLTEWECSDGSTNDLITMVETVNNVAEEETKGVTCLFGLQFLTYRNRKLKVMLEIARTVSCVGSGESCDKCEEELRLWGKGKEQLEVCKTPTKEITSPSQSGIVEASDGEDDVCYDPIPSVPKRKLFRRNLELNFKKEEDLLQKSRATKTASAPSVSIKKVFKGDRGVGKVSKDIASGSKVNELVKIKSELGKLHKDVATGVDKKDLGKLQKDVATGVVKKSKGKSSSNESSASDIYTRRRTNKKL